jgi:hypothetical protein
MVRKRTTGLLKELKNKTFYIIFIIFLFIINKTYYKLTVLPYITIYTK